MALSSLTRTSSFKNNVPNETKTYNSPHSVSQCNWKSDDHMMFWRGIYLYWMGGASLNQISMSCRYSFFLIAYSLYWVLPQTRTWGIFTKHGLTGYNSSAFSEIEPFCFGNKWLHGFQGFYIRCEKVQWGRPASIESKTMVFNAVWWTWWVQQWKRSREKRSSEVLDGLWALVAAAQNVHCLFRCFL